MLRLGHSLRLGQGTHRPAGIGDDAVRAEVDAAVLHLQHGAGAFRHAACGQHLEFPAAQGVVQQRHLLLAAHLLQQVQKCHAVAGTGDEIHVQPRRLLRVGLHVAAAGGHYRVGVQLPASPDHLPRLLVADGGDGAGVDDIDVRLFIKRHQRVAPAHQLLLHGLCFILIHLASQGIDSCLHGILLALSVEYRYNISYRFYRRDSSPMVTLYYTGYFRRWQALRPMKLRGFSHDLSG